VRPRPWLSLAGRVDWLTPRVDGGADDRPIQDVFDDASAPGLARHTDFLRYEVSADVNYRQPLGNPRRGGQYVFTYSHFDDRDLGAYSFSRVDVDLQQYVPVFTERRVLALRLMTSASDAATQNQVPFYLQRTLGGPDDLRGFRRFRFRDENLLLLQAEYRWEIFTAVDGALFYDAGKVASRVEDIDLSDLESDYGIGFRFGTTNGVFLRVEGAFGSRGGKHFVLRYGHVF
jgi:outer membrane protein assembly factor BamA